MTASATLVSALDAIGYETELRQERVSAPGSGVVAELVAFTHLAPQDLRTSAISAFAATPRDDVGGFLDAARSLATPFALIAKLTGDLDVYCVATDEQSTKVVQQFSADEVSELRGSELAAALAPRAIRAAKAGTRQLTLFPIDAQLLANARHRSIDSISGRLEESFALVLRAGVAPTEAARLVITSLASVIVRDKCAFGDIEPHNVVDAGLARHGEYFSGLATWQLDNPNLLEEVLVALGEGVDYSAIDARSINAVYEQLFLTRELRKELGIFHTDLRFASRILDNLPIEEIPPDERYVVDPACGSGNLLLATQERLENLSPGNWSAEDTHLWLKTHIYGSDIEPIAVEIAKLSLLVSSLPLGNSWQIEKRDALSDTTPFPERPTLWVTNPPWRNARGARAEKATQFLNRAIESLADGGLLACILPASWLSGGQHSASRNELASRCNLFEVWSLPRDMFAPEARFPSAVVFAQKARTASRSSFAFRWLTAGKQHREAFLDRGAVQYQSIEDISVSKGFVGGPVDGLAVSDVTVGQIAVLKGGVVQRGKPHPTSAGTGVPFLTRGTSVAIHRMIDAKSITWVSESSENLLASRDLVMELRGTPKLLVQADRGPANSWRLRPVVDSAGVVPSNVWQSIFGEPPTIFALNAFFSTSIASCFVHSRASTRRINLEVLRQIPLPRDWHDRYEQQFADLGSQMADRTSDLPSLVDRAEELAREAFNVEGTTANAIERVMAGYEAPDGRVRFHEPEPLVEVLSGEFNQAPGAVLEVQRTVARIWVHGGPEEGYRISIPQGMPGRLLREGATFELTGKPQSGRYRFHRTAHYTDEKILGTE